ncbi:MAG: response regulator [Candidatus Omnitrophica bacterium]|nr:response regulator [Candidatus Omnitrophota bacterium]
MDKSGKRERILVVDDESNIREAFNEILSQEYDLVLVDNGQEAVEIIKNQAGQPDAVLLDINMPGMSGLEVLCAVKDITIPIIVVSVLEDAKTTLKAMNRGVFAYINKPFDLGELRTILRQALEEKYKRDFQKTASNMDENDLLNLLNYLLNISMDILKADSGLLLMNKEDNTDFVVSMIRDTAKVTNRKERVRLETEVAKWIRAKKLEPVLMQDVNTGTSTAFGCNTVWEFDSLNESKQIKSIVAVPIRIEENLLNAMVMTRSLDQGNFDLNDLEWCRLLGYQAAVIIKNAKFKNISEHSCLETIAVLAAMIEANDPLTRGHSEWVKKYTLLIARQMGMSEESLELLRRAALMHDIGKIGIDSKILNKPGPLSYAQRLIVQKHPLIGIQILRPLKALSKILPIIYYHHEFYDGRGYMNKLKGEEIPLESRILAVADALEAMSSNRPYRRALSREKIIEELETGKGGQFDPQIVQCVLDLIKQNRFEFCDNRTGGTKLSCQSYKKLILIIDDDPDLCLLMKMNLKEFCNFKVITVCDPKEGIEIAKDAKPDMILLDYMMPGLNGFEVLRILKHNNQTSNIPVIMLTVQGDEASKLRAFQLYSDDYITKPVSTEELKIRIETVFQRKEAVFLF